MLVSVARANSHNIGPYLLEHRVVIAKALADFKFLLGVGQPPFVGIGHSHDLCVGHIHPDSVNSVPIIAPAGMADNPHAQFFICSMG